MKNRGRRSGLVVLAVLIGLVVAGYKTEAATSFSGGFQSNLTLRQYEPEGSPVKWGAKNTLRLNFKDINGHLKVEGSFDLSLLAGNDAETYLMGLPVAESSSFQFLGTRWAPLFDTRKLYLSLFFDRATITLGRQIINYGVGYVFSPIDCFSTVDLGDIGLSRTGSDIIRVQIPLGDLAGIEGVTSIAASGTNSAGALKIFGNLKGYDCSLTGIYKRPQEELVIGFTFKGDLGIGIHGELVEHFNSGNTQYFEGMAGADYSLNEGKVLLLMEYYYNGNPIDPDLLTPPDLLALNRTFLGPSYLFGQVSYQYDEIRAFTLNGLVNPAERSWVGTFQFSYNVRQNTNLLFYTRCYAGDLNGINSGTGPKAEYGFGVEVKF